jgi:hypothetical protein
MSGTFANNPTFRQNGVPCNMGQLTQKIQYYGGLSQWQLLILAA